MKLFVITIFFLIFRYGTIVGSEDIDPIRWPGSEWRCIKVKSNTLQTIRSSLKILLIHFSFILIDLYKFNYFSSLVQWDSIPPNTSTQLERVCPWWIEPLGSSKIKGFPKGEFFYIHFSNFRCFDVKFLVFANIYKY
jgi:hypothetical protein